MSQDSVVVICVNNMAHAVRLFCDSLGFRLVSKERFPLQVELRGKDNAYLIQLAEGGEVGDVKTIDHILEEASTDQRIRLEPRYSLQGRGRVAVVGDERVVEELTIKDISLRGLRASLRTRLKVGSDVVLTVTAKGRRGVARGRVVWTDAHGNHGFNIIESSTGWQALVYGSVRKGGESSVSPQDVAAKANAS